MKAPKAPLSGIVESVTRKLDKEGGIVETAKLSSYLSPHRLGGLSGKGLGLEVGKVQVLDVAKTIAHKVDTGGDKPRIKTVLTIAGEGGLDRLLGKEVTLSVVQRDLPGMENPEDEEEEDGEE